MWTWTRIALGAGLAAAVLLANPTKTAAGETIGSAFGRFEVRPSAARMAEVASGEAPFEVGEPACGPTEGIGGTQPVARGDGAPAAPVNPKPSVTAAPRGASPAAPAAEAAEKTGPIPTEHPIENPGKKKSEAACGAEPSSTPISGLHK